MNYELRRLDGIYVGMLSGEELHYFDKACEEGWAERSYEGPGGFLGLAKVRIVGEPKWSMP